MVISSFISKKEEISIDVNMTIYKSKGIIKFEITQILKKTFACL